MDKQQVLIRSGYLDANRTPMEVLLTCTTVFRYQHDPELRQGHQPIF